jgi:hypothetical protein
VRLEGSGQSKNAMASSGFESVTFRFGTSRLNQLRYRMLRFPTVGHIFLIRSKHTLRAEHFFLLTRNEITRNSGGYISLGRSRSLRHFPLRISASTPSLPHYRQCVREERKSRRGWRGECRSDGLDRPREMSWTTVRKIRALPRTTHPLISVFLNP